MGSEIITLKFTRAVLCFAVTAAAAEVLAASAEDVALESMIESVRPETEWSPRMGSITSEQETEIELLSQDLNLDEFRPMSLHGKETFAFDAEAHFILKNGSLSKKKPNVLIPLCTAVSDRIDPALLDPKIFALKVFIDKTPVDSLHLVRQGRNVFARFSVKFNAKTRHEITVSFKLFAKRFDETDAGVLRPYTVFDYHFEDAAKWKGKVGFSRISVKMPYKATSFNTHLYGADKPFKYKNRVAYYDKRRLDTDNAAPITFFVASLGFVDKVERAEKRVKALPGTLKRRIQLADLLSQYPGAQAQLAKQLDIVLKTLNKDQDGPVRKHQIELFIQYLRQAARFEEDRTPCDEAACIEQNLISQTAHVLCMNDEACKTKRDLRIDHCCNPKPLEAVATETPPQPQTPEANEKKAPKKAARNLPRVEKPSVISKYFEYFVSHWPIFLAVLIVLGWIYFSSRAKKRPQMKELE